MARTQPWINYIKHDFDKEFIIQNEDERQERNGLNCYHGETHNKNITKIPNRSLNLSLNWETSRTPNQAVLKRKTEKEKNNIPVKKKAKSQTQIKKKSSIKKGNITAEPKSSGTKKTERPAKTKIHKSKKTKAMAEK